MTSRIGYIFISTCLINIIMSVHYLSHVPSDHICRLTSRVGTTAVLCQDDYVSRIDVDGD